MVIVPAAWGIQKSKKYIKSYFNNFHDINVRDVSPRLVETVHSQCGGLPGFCKHFLDALFNHDPPILQFAEMKYKGEKKLSFCSEFAAQLNRTDIYSSLPIPPAMRALSHRYLDRLEPRQLLCLKTAATICIAKGKFTLSCQNAVNLVT